jgi:hypothetical protein
MSRQEKIGAVVLGVLLFAGLFYFIYTTMKNPLPLEPGADEFAGDTFNDEGDLGEENTPEEMAVSTETANVPELSTETATAPAAAPVSAPAPRTRNTHK